VGGAHPTGDPRRLASGELVFAQGLEEFDVAEITRSSNVSSIPESRSALSVASN
jgi:hypothetical protein